MSLFVFFSLHSSNLRTILFLFLSPERVTCRGGFWRTLYNKRIFIYVYSFRRGIVCRCFFLPFESSREFTLNIHFIQNVSHYKRSFIQMRIKTFLLFMRAMRLRFDPSYNRSRWEQTLGGLFIQFKELVFRSK